jgi:monolysocardiolipin acyltransferase
MRCIPIVRGDGLNQQGVVDALDHLNNGGWMHLHPEGKVNKDLSNVLPLRHGVGKLIAESKVTPVVLPIFHLGMANVISYNGRFPRPRADLLFMVGKPIYFDETLEKLRKEGLEKVEIYNRVTDVVEAELRALEKKANWLYRDIYKHEPYPNYVPPD